jgi:hypothetical protein
MTARAQKLRRHTSAKNIVIVRYWNNDIFSNLEGVLTDFVAVVETRASEVSPSPTLPLSGGGSVDLPGSMA